MAQGWQIPRTGSSSLHYTPYEHGILFSIRGKLTSVGHTTADDRKGAFGYESSYIESKQRALPACYGLLAMPLLLPGQCFVCETKREYAQEKRRTEKGERKKPHRGPQRSHALTKEPYDAIGAWWRAVETLLCGHVGLGGQYGAVTAPHFKRLPVRLSSASSFLTRPLSNLPRTRHSRRRFGFTRLLHILTSTMTRPKARSGAWYIRHRQRRCRVFHRIRQPAHLPNRSPGTRRLCNNVILLHPPFLCEN